MGGNGVKQDRGAEKQNLLSLVEQRRQGLHGLQRELEDIERVLSLLRKKQHQIDLLGDVCRSLEALNTAGGEQLLGKEPGVAGILETARQQISEQERAMRRAELRRAELLDGIRERGQDLHYLRLELIEAEERERIRANEWLIERDPSEAPDRETVMPWARSGSEDSRFRWSLVLTVIVTSGLGYAISQVSVPMTERSQQLQLPERMARLVREERKAPPPKPVDVPIEDEEIPEPEPELADEQPPQETPDASNDPEVPVLSEREVKEKVKTKGILAFRDSFASRANLSTTVQLGSQARLRAVGDDATSRPERSMVTSNAPGLDGAINLADISRDVPGGGAIADVEVARVASTIETDGAIARPQTNTALAGRTDEDIQIVFDRYKSALYRLYNRELRRDPRLRGQVVLELTIEPDGSVSSCSLQSSNMNSPELVQQVIERVQTFDFGARQDTDAITIIYPIDFMPAG